jgi:hypothetical protein
MHIRYWWESKKKRDQWEDEDVGGWTILKWILRETGWDGVDWIDLAQDRELSGSLKCWEVLEWLHN